MRPFSVSRSASPILSAEHFVWQNEFFPAPDVATGGAVAFPTTPNDQFHFYYQPPPYTQIHQLYFNGTSWQVVDLPGGTGNVSGDGGMAGFAVGNLQYVFYISQD